MCKKHILSISMCFSSKNEIISNFMCLNLALFSQLFFMWKRIFLVWGKQLPDFNYLKKIEKIIVILIIFLIFCSG